MKTIITEEKSNIKVRLPWHLNILIACLIVLAVKEIIV